MSRLSQIFSKSVPAQEVTTDNTLKRLSVAPGDGAWMIQTPSEIPGPLKRAILETRNGFKPNEPRKALDSLNKEKGVTNSQKASLNESEDEQEQKHHNFE